MNFILLISLFLSRSAYGAETMLLNNSMKESDSTEKGNSSETDFRKFQRKMEAVMTIYGGYGYGPENPFAFPKIGIGFRPFNLNGKRHLVEPYIGVTGSFCIIVVGFANIGIESGVLIKNLSIDASLTYSAISSWEAARESGDSTDFYTVGPAEKLTFNPKIGLKIWAFWFRIGQSFELKEYLRDSDKMDPKPPPTFKYFLKNGSKDFLNLDFLVAFPF